MDNDNGADLTDDCAVGGARRDGEKIGRSLVGLNEDRGIAHNGLPRPSEPCVFALSTGTSDTVGKLISFVALCVGIAIAASSESVRACEKALTRPKPVIRHTRNARAYTIE